jgi:hypothetical protein
MDSPAARLRVVAVIGVLGLLAGVALLPGGAAAEKDSTVKRAAEGRLRPAVLITPAGVARTIPSLSGGTITVAAQSLASREAENARDDDDREESRGGPSAAGLGISQGALGCGRRNTDGNTRVNQDCSFRRQAETTITYNPANPDTLLAGQNDSRSGFNQCGIDWSLDNGQHFGDLLPPFREKINNPGGEEPTPSDPNRHTIVGGPGTLHTYDAATDPVVAMDSRGNGFFGCVVADVFSSASGLFVTRSPSAAAGSFFFDIPSGSRAYVVAEDNSPTVVHDKPFLAADRFVNSPNRDNVYVTWTVFRFGANCLGGTPDAPAECEQPIFGSMTTDQGHHWSTPEEISGVSDTLCFFGNFFQPSLNEHSCNLDHGPDPTVLPNGDLVVIFNNSNTALNNPNAQQLAVRCKPTGDSAKGTAHLNCGAPSKVGDDIITGEPLCEFGTGPQECIPGAFIRTNDFPRINKNVNADMHLFASWQDYRNGEFDIQLSRSTDGGQTWKEVGTVNPDRGRDHYMTAIDLASSNRRAERDDDEDDNDGRGRDDQGQDRVGVSYYRTDRVANENAPQVFGCPPGTTTTPPNGPQVTCSGTGPNNSDYVLSGGVGSRTPFRFRVLSPEFAPPDGIQTGFNGDYSGLTINRGTEAHPIWSDTRNSNPFPENGVVHDEDVFTTTVQLPR